MLNSALTVFKLRGLCVALGMPETGGHARHHNKASQPNSPPRLAAAMGGILAAPKPAAPVIRSLCPPAAARGRGGRQGRTHAERRSFRALPAP